MIRLEKLLESGHQGLLTKGLKGIEKESLRIAKNGFIAQTRHPAALGSALTHPHITTDYSEALLEFITPPFADIRDSLTFMKDIHQFVYDNLNGELLLAASMPCGINGDASIPIAEYGRSNIGRMKHIYRRGLAYRYGRTMQAIAGIHFNYSVPEALWPILKQLENNPQSLEQFVADAYFGLIRNFQRLGWIILYLFGASPAICKSFFKSRPQHIADFDEFDRYTLFHPYATSLRMSDIGYKSSNQANLEIDYNTLSGYIQSLSQAIETPYSEYAKIGIKVNGEYRQLNSNALQIENEYYSTIRPKQVAYSGEKPTLALKRRGIRYVEIRSKDLNLFDPIGINDTESRFIEALLLTCLLLDSPASCIEEQAINNDNQLIVAHRGRKPGQRLHKDGRKIPLTDWAHEIFSAMQPICEILDENETDRSYSNALTQLRQLIDNPDLTPSAKILAGMQQNNLPFASYALRLSAQHEQHFRNNTLCTVKANDFKSLSTQSILEQQAIEQADTLPFDDFLQQYFSQT